MTVTVQCNAIFALSRGDVDRLWAETRTAAAHGDDEITIKCVDEEESKRLNKKYRDQDAATNVLTFTYNNDLSRQELPLSGHDIALCLAVAEREARDRRVALRDYIAVLLVHAFLHAAGMNHERSDTEAKAAQQAERKILKSCGFLTLNL